jgi:uncharacterized membrane protein
VLLDTFHGLPTHALIVHFTVVALPTAAITGIIVALWPWARRRYGAIVGLLTVAAYAAVPFSVQSGERLFARQSALFGPQQATEAGLMQKHEDLALAMQKWTVLLLIGVMLVVLPPLVIRWDRRRGRAQHRVSVPVGAGAPTGGDGSMAARQPAARQPAAGGRLELSEPGGPSWQLPVMVVGIVLTLIGGIMTLIMVAQVGEAGARAAWEHLNEPVATQTN